MLSSPMGYPNPGFTFQNQYPFYPASPNLYTQPAPYGQLGLPYQTPYTPLANAMQRPVFPQDRRVSLAPAITIPDAETVKNRLTAKKGSQAGLKYGLIAGMMGSLPIWAIERWMKEPNLIQQTVQVHEQMARPHNMKWTHLLSRYSFPSSMACTMLISALGGASLGAWTIHQTQKKLVSIADAQKAQKQGTFQPPTPTLFQRLGLASQPMTNPDAAFRDMLHQDLDEQQAFWHGAKLVLLAKVIPGVISIGLSLLLLKLMRKSINQDEAVQLAMRPFELFMKAPLQPVLLAKLCAFPFLGGLIAKQMIPWTKQQLGLDKTTPSTR